MEPKSHHHATLPAELIQHILRLAALSSPSTALRIALVSRASYQLASTVLDSWVSLRTPDDTLRLVNSHIRNPSRASSIRAVFLNNRDAAADPNFPSSSSQSLQMLLQATQNHNPSDADAQQEQENPSLPSSLTSILRAHQEEKAASRQQNAELSAQLIGTILSFCRNLEMIYFWEPFTINYPPELSTINHLLPYPLQTLTEATAIADKKQSSHNRYPNFHPLKEIVISALAFKPEHLLESGLSQPTTKSAFEKLTHLHLHWPSLTPDLLRVLTLLPSLCHLRLSRPGPGGLAPGLQHLLNLEMPIGTRQTQAGLSKQIHQIIVELGLYLEQAALDTLQALERQAGGRLLLLGKDGDRSKFNATWLQFEEISSWREWRDRLQGRPGCWITHCSHGC